MAKGRQGSESQGSTNRFDKGLNTNIKDYHLDNQSWVYARNAINNTHTGDLGGIGNEPANRFCANAAYDIIGAIHLEKDLWAIYSTNDVDSEIGTFASERCEYVTIVNDRCLNFRKTHLITGASRRTFDCSFQVYWADNKLNPDRTLVLNDVPWIQECVDTDGCITCVDTEELDCSKILLESRITQPCVRLERSASGGSILNGSYFAHIAYMVNGIRATDYFPMSNILSLFDNGNLNASIDIFIDGLDQNFDEYELVLVQTIAEKLSVRRIGTYSTNQNKVSIDNVDETLPAIKPENLLITNPIADRSEGVYNVGKYLFRSAVVGKFDFNYQPLANQIVAKWQTVEYPKYYYRDGGTNIGHMRDEVYSYFIRFRYTTGDVSNSYHIPGRGPVLYSTPDGSGTLLENDNYLPVNDNNLENLQGLTSKVFEMFNTASGAPVNIVLADGGIVTAEGLMGYHESSEIYPDRTPEVWNSNVQGRPEWDLCGKPIRHHKMPENTLYAGGGSSDITNHYTDDGETIRILAVAFENIQPPLDNDGNPIPNIEGYEILRGSRDGNKTVLFKGLINNMREYDIPDKFNSGRQGLYPNYPFNSLDPDPFNSTLETSFETIGGLNDYIPNPEYSKTHFTFHSPDTMFNKPFIGLKELKVYGAMYGNAECEYIEPADHPKHVFVTDASFVVGIMVGIGLGIAKVVGKRTVTIKSPTAYNYPLVVGDPSTTPLSSTVGAASFTGALGTTATAETFNNNLAGIISALTGVDANQSAHLTSVASQNLLGIEGSGYTVFAPEYTQEEKSSVPLPLRVVTGANMFFQNVSEGADLTLNLIRNASKPRQFARQGLAYCGYEKFYRPDVTNKRRLLDEANYLDSHLQNYQTDHRINNILRNKTVAFNTFSEVEDLIGAVKDTTFNNVLMSQLPNADEPVFSRRASSHYVAFKTRLRNQYGQLNSIRQLPTSSCITPISETQTGTIFGGDTYIGRYQEKNTFYHFYKWLQDQPNFAEFNYHLYDAVQHSAFWMDTDPFDLQEFTSSISTAFNDFVASGQASDFFQGLVTPSDKHCFDRANSGTGLFTLRNVWMYLFHSSVRDFFVESELNIDHRGHDDSNATRHWDALQDLRQMFDMRLIRAGNLYKLDRSLSVSRLPFTKLSWGIMQDRDYSPTLAESCYTDYPLRLLYSLPQETALKKDNWSVFLANNYKDFESKVTTVQAVRSTGIMILFEDLAPGLYPGVDELQLKSGTSITVGDGGLFVREMQSVSNADAEYQYGSCQSRRGVCNTPAGLFFLSNDQGKVFMFGEGLKEVSLRNDLYWFNKYLPYQLIKDFPEYDIIDNPVGGIGCQIEYDNEWSILYITKKDYRLKPEYVDITEYIGNGLFLVDGIATIETGDPRYFDSASWTVSFDPKNQQDISFHDWHPGLMMGGPNSFFTTKNRGIWEHNTLCDLYCNYYNEDYPFEIEFQLDNLPAITTIKNLEYYMQVFEYEDNCWDRFHVLDFNFDQAVVYNSEQTSGLLRLNLNPKNDVSAMLQYPIFGLNQIDILYSKEEQKYRFNEFWDMTRDRGEFTLTSEPIWLTEANGYIKNLNPVNLNYQKSEFERKRIRHNNNRVLLRRTVSNNKKMILLIANTKIQNSLR